MNIKTKRTADGASYNVLETPCTVNYTIHTFSEHKNTDGFRFCHLYVPCNELKSNYLPTDANPREPSNNRQIEEIQNTLQYHPEKFHKRNNGITIVCDSVSYDEKKKVCEIKFGTGRGICNGGHTYFSIVATPFQIDPNALVHLELIELPNDLEESDKRAHIVDIAKCRNNNMRLKIQSQADYQGYYDMFKRFLRDQRKVVWHEGDSNASPNAIRSEHLVRLLAATDPKWFYHPIFSISEKSHKKAAMSIDAIHTEWFVKMDDTSLPEKPLTYMAVLLEDILSIRDMISFSLLHDRDLGPFKHGGLWKNWLKNEGEYDLLTDPSKKGVSLPPTFEVLVVGLFRTDIWLGIATDGTVKYIGWYIDPKKLWNLRKKPFLESFTRAFRDFNQEPLTFIRAETIYDNHLYQIGTGATAPLPQIIYDARSGQKFVEDSSAPTHFLDITGEIELKNISGALPSNVKTFRAE